MFTLRAFTCSFKIGEHPRSILVPATLRFSMHVYAMPQPFTIFGERWGLGMGAVVGSRTSGAASVRNLEVSSPLALRPRDAAKVLGISPRLLWDLTAPRGPIPSARIGKGRRKTVLYSLTDLQSWLKRQTTAAPEGGEE